MLTWTWTLRSIGFARVLFPTAFLESLPRVLEGKHREARQGSVPQVRRHDARSCEVCQEPCIGPVCLSSTTTTHDFREKNLTCMEY